MNVSVTPCSVSVFASLLHNGLINDLYGVSVPLR